MRQVSSLDGEGVVGELTYHGRWLSFADVSARFLIIVVHGGAV